MTTDSMNKFDALRKRLNQQQTKLRRVMLGFDQHEIAISLFLNQHAMLHSAKITPSDTWSFEDAVLKDMSNEQIRRIPKNREHSVAWLLWHMARIEDVAMNLLVAGSPQTLHEENWFLPMKVKARDTGNATSAEEIAQLSATIDVDVLRAYRLAVGSRTREIVLQLPPDSLKNKVESTRLQNILDQGAVVAAASGLIDYWRRRNIAGLLLMPATRHNIVHLNAAYRIKKKS
jgi:hypothetical protein